MAKLQVRFYCHGKWDYWEDCDSESATVRFDDLREGEAWDYRVVEDEPSEPQLQTRTFWNLKEALTMDWHDVVFVDGVLSFPGEEFTRQIRVKPSKPTFKAGYFLCLQAHAGYSVSDVKWWDIEPRLTHWGPVRVLPNA
jgi:hypothetical protein